MMTDVGLGHYDVWSGHNDDCDVWLGHNESEE